MMKPAPCLEEEHAKVEKEFAARMALIGGVVRERLLAAWQRRTPQLPVGLGGTLLCITLTST